MTDTAIEEGEIVNGEEEETSMVFCFDDTEDDQDEEFVFEDPDDDPLDGFGGGLHRIKADGGDGNFYDDKDSLGNVLECVIIDMTATKHLWVPEKGKKPELESLLAGFPNDKPICYNTDMFHEEARLHRDLSEDQRHILKSKGAGGNCNDCRLFKDCGFGQDLLIMTTRYDEPVVVSMPATSAGPLRDFFKKEFKVKGRSIALSTYPVQFTSERLEEKDPVTGKTMKYFRFNPKRGKKLPNETIKAYLGLRETYRISRRQDQKKLPEATATADKPPASTTQQAPPAQDGGDPWDSEEAMFS